MIYTMIGLNSLLSLLSEKLSILVISNELLMSFLSEKLSILVISNELLMFNKIMEKTK